jgi:hypothetical protein
MKKMGDKYKLLRIQTIATLNGTKILCELKKGNLRPLFLIFCDEIYESPDVTIMFVIMIVTCTSHKVT